MSEQINTNNQAIELSEDELEVVSGGCHHHCCKPPKHYQPCKPQKHHKHHKC